MVYVALGSHANYFTPGEYWVRPFPLRDHASAAGTAVRPTLQPLNGDLGWLDWPGDWGSSGSPNDSPPGPAFHEKQWRRPDRYHADARGPRRRKVLGTILVAEEERTTPPPERLSAPASAIAFGLPTRCRRSILTIPTCPCVSSSRSIGLAVRGRPSRTHSM